MLEAINLSKNYNGATALDAPNLNIEAGEIFCLLGANGAGKTTTINLFLNFIKPDGGKALINGLDVAANSLETKKYLAYIPEQVNLYKNLSGLENLEYFSALAGQDKYSKSELRTFLFDAGLQSDAIEKRISGLLQRNAPKSRHRHRRRETTGSMRETFSTTARSSETPTGRRKRRRSNRICSAARSAGALSKTSISFSAATKAFAKN